MNVYDTANKLAYEMKNSEEYKAYKEAKDKIDNTKQIFDDFKQFQVDVNNNAFKKFTVKNNPISLYDSYDEDFENSELNKNKILD